MQKQLIALTLILGLSSAIYAQNNINSIGIGTALPAGEVKLKDINGEETTLKAATKEKGLLVMFTCNTCPYVVRNQERTKEVSKYAKEKGFGVVLINSNAGARDGADSYASMKEYAQKQGYNWNYVVDENAEVANAFGASRTPEVYLFDKNGNLAYKGAIDDSPADASAVKRAHLKSALDEVASGQSVSVKESRSVGCGIKRI